VELQGLDTKKLGDILDRPFLLVDKNPDGRDKRRQLVNDLARLLRAHKTGTLLVKNKTQRPSPQLNRLVRVVRIRYPANFHSYHHNFLSLSTIKIINTLTSVLGNLLTYNPARTYDRDPSLVALAQDDPSGKVAKIPRGVT